MSKRRVMEDDFATLRLFNEKVERLAATGLMKRYSEGVPEVIATCEDVSLEQTGPTEFALTARMWSKVPSLDRDEVDAFVLTYRMFTQRNDRISLPSFARIYEQAWMPPEAAERFAHARAEVNAYLDSPTSLLDGSKPIMIRHLVDVVIYGGLAHTNRNKERIYRAWMDPGGITGFIWAEFIAALKRMMHYLDYFRDLNHAVLVNCADEPSTGGQIRG